MKATRRSASIFRYGPSPPTTADHIWRSMRHEDAATLQRLEGRCAVSYGNRVESTLKSCAAKLAAGDNLDFHSLCAVNAAGELAAAGIVSFHPVGTEMRFSLDGNVAPEHCGRGVGTYLLQWMEEAARNALNTRMPKWRGLLCIDFFDRRDQAISLFEAHGFRHQVSEYDMRRRLDSPLPNRSLPDNLKFTNWTPELANACYTAYQAAFRERPGFPDWSVETWQAVFVDCDEFNPDVTVLVLDGGSPVAYAICHIDTPNEDPQEPIGWVAQLGVMSAWRRRGIASAMLAEAMRRFSAAGLAHTALEVNINNPQALRVYLQMGYRHYMQYTSYRKPA